MADNRLFANGTHTPLRGKGMVREERSGSRQSGASNKACERPSHRRPPDRNTPDRPRLNRRQQRGAVACPILVLRGGQVNDGDRPVTGEFQCKKTPVRLRAPRFGEISPGQRSPSRQSSHPDAPKAQAEGGGRGWPVIAQRSYCAVYSPPSSCARSNFLKNVSQAVTGIPESGIAFI